MAYQLRGPMFSSSFHGDLQSSRTPVLGAPMSTYGIRKH